MISTHLLQYSQPYRFHTACIVLSLVVAQQITPRGQKRIEHTQSLAIGIKLLNLSSRNISIPRTLCKQFPHFLTIGGYFGMSSCFDMS